MIHVSAGSIVHEEGHIRAILPICQAKLAFRSVQKPMQSAIQRSYRMDQRQTLGKYKPGEALRFGNPCCVVLQKDTGSKSNLSPCKEEGDLGPAEEE